MRVIDRLRKLCYNPAQNRVWPAQPDMPPLHLTPTYKFERPCQKLAAPPLFAQCSGLLACPRNARNARNPLREHYQRTR